MAYRHARLNRRGLSLVEFALVLPLLVMLVCAAMEYGWAFMQSGVVVNAARQGARIGVRVDATNADVMAAVAALMGKAKITGYGTTILQGDVSRLHRGDNLTVTVTIPYSGTGNAFNLPFLPIPAQLQSSVTMSKEGA